MTAIVQEKAAKRLPSEYVFKSWDGTELFYRTWPGNPVSKKSLILLHRGHEHSGRYQEIVDLLGLTDFHIFAWDARGHGRSPGERGYADNFACVVRDIDAFIAFVSSEYDLPIESMTLLGHSVGGVAVAAWVHDYAPPIRAMVLVTPSFRVKLYVPLALLALRLRMLLGGRSFIKSYVKGGMLTHDPEQAVAYGRDPLVSRSIATNILIDLHDTATRLMADAGAIRVPTLLLGAGSDWVVKNSALRKFFQRLGSPIKQMDIFPRFYHAILHEQDRREPIAKIAQFIDDMYSQPAESQSLLQSDRRGYTREEYQHLSEPLPLSLTRLHYAMQRLSMKTICRLSEGVRLGWKTGFDSGESLDYVYRNQPRGTTPLGELIDWFYLNSIGWTGIRQRKIHLQEMLKEAIGKIRDDGQPVRIVDIAAGGGRYLLELLRDLNAPDVEALLRDRSPQALDVARKTAVEMELAHVTFAQGDAFNAESLATINPRPAIAIISGLYELFDDNEMILASLHGLSRAILPGGFLVYTNQPWHPQLEMIARVLINREQKPWIMRRRTQAEMDELVRAAGFTKIGMKIDRFGIFTVSLARKLTSA